MGNIRSSQKFQNHLFLRYIFCFTPNLLKLFKNVNNIMKTQFFVSFTLRPSDLITTLTCVLMDNFCPCFIISAVQVWCHK